MTEIKPRGHEFTFDISNTQEYVEQPQIEQYDPLTQFNEEKTILNLTARSFILRGIDNEQVAKDLLEGVPDIQPGSIPLPNTEAVNKLEATLLDLFEALNYGLDPTSPFFTTIVRPRESIHQHSHNVHQPGAMAFAYYAQLPQNCGDISYGFNNFTVGSQIRPTVGELLIFPSWIQHRTERNLSNLDRVSVSGNLLQGCDCDLNTD